MDLYTPLELYVKLASGTNSFLLESADTAGSGGRYSIIGFASDEVISYEDGHIIHELKRKKERIKTDKPLQWLAQYWRAFTSTLVIPENLEEHRFCGGLVGMFSWELALLLEPYLVSRNKPALTNVPLLSLMVCKEFAIFDTWRQTVSICLISEITNQGFRAAQERLDKILGKLKRNMSKPTIAIDRSREAHSLKRVKYHSSDSSYCRSVEEVQKLITEGDVMQVVLSQCRSIPYTDDPIKLYRLLRLNNPSPYLIYFHFRQFDLIGSSPELLVSLDKDRTATLKPFAGTRRRGANAEEDARLAEELSTSEKERAEHAMLIDLGRNDLNQVCASGSVKLHKTMQVERFSKVMHLSTTIKGSLQKDKDAFDLFKCVFPAGTLSGAPKIKAMQIIEDYEPYCRGSYGGAVGYISAGGCMDLAITIRSMLYDHQRIYVQSGAGIVYDSQPKHELKECHSKAKALLNSLAML